MAYHFSSYGTDFFLLFTFYSPRNLAPVPQFDSYVREELRAGSAALHRGIELKPHKTSPHLGKFLIIILLYVY